jgi:hypothetical protein
VKRKRRGTRTRLAAALGSALLGGAWLCNARPALARSPSCEQTERYTLKNGLEVVLRPDHELPNVAIVSSVHAGSRNDPPGYEGLAHYVEHLTFRETQGLPATDELYKQAGGTDVNAFTKLDTTDYFGQFPRAQIERGLWVEARRIAIGLDLVSVSAAEEEHEVILREHALRFGSGVGSEVSTSLFEALYPEGHPYHSLHRQTEATVRALTLTDARWFFARYYRPDRIRLTLLGDFEPSALRPLIDKYFSGLASRELPASPGSSASGGSASGGSASASAASPQTELDAAECKRAEMSGPPLHGSVSILTRNRRESVGFLWLPPAGSNAERWQGILDVFTRRIGEAARDAKVASGAHLELVHTELGDYWMISVDVLPLQPLNRVPEIMSSAFADLKKSPPDAAEQNAERQALELRDSAERSLLSRALDLSRRECHVTPCLAAADRVSAEVLAGIDHFDPAHALRLEIRHSASASIDGEVERVP